MWTLEELGLQFQREDVGGEFGGNREPQFLLLNPNGLVPVLIDGDFAIWESNTILRYLAARYGEHVLWEPDAMHRARVDRWLDWQLSTAGPPATLLTTALVHKPPRVVPADDLERAKRRLAEAMRIVDQQLADHRYLAGERFSLADIAVGIVAHRERSLPIVRESLPHLQRWFDEISARDAFTRSVPVPD